MMKKNMNFGLILSTALLFWGSIPPAMAQSGEPGVISTASDRKKVSITVYNQNFGLVRELRELKALKQGRLSLEFRDVASNIQPETVYIRSVSKPAAFRVLEQNYRYDLLTPQTLLEKHVGKPVRVYRYHETLGKEEGFNAELLSNAEGPVLKLNGEVTFGYPGRLAFAQVPENLVAKPTLMWLVESQALGQTVEVSYLTQGLNWSADYVLVINDADTRGDLNGWVTLVNQSGTSYRDAELKLVAGDVNRVQQPSDQMMTERTMSAVAAPEMRQESMFEYHMYTLGRPATVLQNEQKQVELLKASGVTLQKKLIFYGENYFFRGQYGEVLSNKKVGVYVDIQNSLQNQLGVPLPKGVLRVYKADQSGAQQFVGEDRIEHTPRDERVRVRLGDAFDVVGDRKQTEWRSLGKCAAESAWEIELRNHKDAPVEVEDYEPVGADWTIMSSSHPAQKKDARTFTFTVRVPARGKVKLNYRVSVRWC